MNQHGGPIKTAHTPYDAAINDKVQRVSPKIHKTK